ncbi:hypothetical protein RND71_023128 [Anisodus tanguticus]|uniref:Uncharacterized protein n=1 Tax=Anisodus tanguticus TaxID=243964 RepID=A0AAE1V5S5_9SOLA|nr:hypothetical protein RND71_023128 [Anisodus tanguticus]
MESEAKEAEEEVVVEEKAEVVAEEKAEVVAEEGYEGEGEGRGRDQKVNPYSHKQLAQCRLAFCGVDNLEEWSSSGSVVGSVFYRNEEDTVITSRFFRNFKFLYVKESILSSMANLWNVGTLILKGSGGNLTVPITIWKMVKLRQLHIFNDSFALENAEELLEDSLELYDLKTLSTQCFPCMEDVELMLRKTPNLRELICRFKGINRGQFPVFDFPTRLETLHIFPMLEEAHRRYPVCISASNFKKLTVECFRLGIENLSNIFQLQNLRVLELVSVNFDDKRWEVSNDEFSQLKVLTLSNCYFEEWTVTDDAFPNLQRLSLACLPITQRDPFLFRRQRFFTVH